MKNGGIYGFSPSRKKENTKWIILFIICRPKYILVPDQLQHLGEEAAKYGKNVLFCYGGGSIKKNGLYDKAMASLNEAGLHVTELSGIEPNPKIESVYKGAEVMQGKPHRLRRCGRGRISH